MNAIDRPGLAAPLQGLPESERTLLIVDDDAPLHQRLARAMERRGFIVQTADSVASGVAAATANPPAFAVVDLRLGDGSGLDVVSALREARPGARIVMLTGYDDERFRLAAQRVGANDFIVKPFQPNALLARLAAWLDIPSPAAPPGGDVPLSAHTQVWKSQEAPWTATGNHSSPGDRALVWNTHEAPGPELSEDSPLIHGREVLRIQRNAERRS